MEDKKKLILAIVSVVAIILAVGGATFAYWSWQTNTAQRTNVTFTIENPNASGDMTARIDGNGTSTVKGLAPTSNCAGTNALVKTVPIYYKNNTINRAKITANLTLKNLTAGNVAINYSKLSYIKWAITTSSSSCTTGAVASGDFSTITSASSVPKQLASLENTVNANVATETKLTTYYLYVWLDSEYRHTNEGSVNSDPMQGLSFTLEWSGTMEQVA